jgi:hypothetical protein
MKVYCIAVERQTTARPSSRFSSFHIEGIYICYVLRTVILRVQSILTCKAAAAPGSEVDPWSSGGGRLLKEVARAKLWDEIMPRL